MDDSFIIESIARQEQEDVVEDAEEDYELDVLLDNEDEEEEKEITASIWMADLMESFVESTEVTLAAAASTLREGVNDTMQTVAANIMESEFYKNNLTYVPPAPEVPVSPARSVHSTENNSQGEPSRRGSFLSVEEDVLNEVESMPLEARIAAAGQSIGYLNVKVSQAKRLTVDGTRIHGTTHPYLQIKLGPYQQWTSAVAKEHPTQAGKFQFNREIQLVVQDINTDLIIEVRQKHVLVTDALIGQILIPLTSILPPVKEALSGKIKRCEPYRLSSWFEMFPLPDGKKKFVPAAADIAKTGMCRPESTLGYLHIDLELHLHGRVSMWAGYALPPSKRFIDLPKHTTPTGDLKAMSAVVETGRGFKRNFQRVRVAFSRVFSRGKYVWAPLRLLKKARTFQDLRITLFVVSLVTFGCLIAPPFLLPINLYLILFVSVMNGYGTSGDDTRSYVVWNQEIRDPDENLGSFQKVAKLIYLLEKFELWMGLAADVLERMVHVFSFADERVTFAALVTVGMFAIGLSLMLLLLSPGYLFFFGFMFWFTKPLFRSKFKSLRKEKTTRKDTKQAVLSRLQHHDDSLREGGKLTQALAVGKLVVRTPKLAKNIFGRVPTEDELGHRWICRLQRVQGEPLSDSESDEEDEGLDNDEHASLIRAAQTQDDGIWLREM